jgi:hypothetical protein
LALAGGATGEARASPAPGGLWRSPSALAGGTTGEAREPLAEAGPAGFGGGPDVASDAVAAPSVSRAPREVTPRGRQSTQATATDAAAKVAAMKRSKGVGGRRGATKDNERRARVRFVDVANF